MIDAYDQLLKAGTATISDIFDTMSRVPLVLANDILSATGPNVPFAGPAYTITGESHRYASGDRNKLAAIDAIPAGAVAVWAGTNIRGTCCFGDLLAEAMMRRGCIGVVVDGGVRDVAYLREMGMPVLARYHSPAQAIGRWRVTDSQVPVQVRGALEDWISVYPADIVVSDDDGLVIVPKDDVSEVIQRVAKWSDAESGARADIREGLSLIEALDKHGHL